jgi:anti-anti-sigma regulatory factor
VIDLCSVALLDSIGLQAVLETLDQYDIEGHLAIVIDSRTEAITRLELSALGELIDIHHDMASALRACSRASVSTGGRHRAKIPA